MGGEKKKEAEKKKPRGKERTGKGKIAVVREKGNRKLRGTDNRWKKKRSPEFASSAF